MILKKKNREFFRYKIQFLQISIFWFLGFAKFAKFTIKTTTELVKLKRTPYVKSKDVNHNNYGNLFFISFSWQKIYITYSN